eukprot:TRINITY_DN2843_c0_g1_i11.p1 TRINITY_DN2843_c0_g1~~TRINITY_DN2843_c0_g1_i11.p1  ORF type:complete len:1046 (-),score=191.94 TRINITY_DN2843_c0_g1_i11:710-3847(-)
MGAPCSVCALLLMAWAVCLCDGDSTFLSQMFDSSTRVRLVVDWRYPQLGVNVTIGAPADGSTVDVSLTANGTQTSTLCFLAKEQQGEILVLLLLCDPESIQPVCLLPQAAVAGGGMASFGVDAVINPSQETPFGVVSVVVNLPANASLSGVNATTVNGSLGLSYTLRQPLARGGALASDTACTVADGVCESCCNLTGICVGAPGSCSCPAGGCDQLRSLSFSATVTNPSSTVTDGELVILFNASSSNATVGRVCVTIDQESVPRVCGRTQIGAVVVVVDDLSGGQHTAKVAATAADALSVTSVTVTFTVVPAESPMVIIDLPGTVVAGHSFNGTITTEGAVVQNFTLSEDSPGAVNYSQSSVHCADAAAPTQCVLTVTVFAFSAAGDAPVRFIFVLLLQGGTTNVTFTTVLLTQGTLLPLRSDSGGVALGTPSQLATPSTTPNATVVSVSCTPLLQGRGIVVNVTVRGQIDPALQYVLLGVTGFSGHLRVPLSAFMQVNSSSTGLRIVTTTATFSLSDVTLPFGSVMGSSSVSSTSLSASLQDSSGQSSEPVETPTNLGKEEQGALHFRMEFDTLSDVDLHVTDPSGAHIYFGNPTANGGTLDLDSNAGCNIDGVNAENVFYDAPMDGEYTVGAMMYDVCETAGANFGITATGCDADATFSGTLGFTGDFQSFKVKATCKKDSVVQGTLKFKFTDRFGNSVTAPVPAGVTVQVRTANANTIVGTSSVGVDGKYKISYKPVSVKQPHQVSGFSLSMMLCSNSAQVVLLCEHRAAVVASSETSANTHRTKLNPVIVPDTERQAVRDSFVTDNTMSGCLAIIQTLAQGFNYFEAHGYHLSPVKVAWTAGRGTIYGGTVHHQGTIYVEGRGVGDQFDPSTLLHEYSHYFNLRFGPPAQHQSTPHSLGAPSTAGVAFTEGFATFLGQSVIGDTIYRDRTLSGGTYFDFLVMFKPGTVPPNSTQGNQDEAMVSSLLWEIKQRAGGGDPTIVLQFVTGPLLLQAAQRHGVPNVADLADVLHFLLCPNKPLADALDLPVRYLLDWLTLPGFCA